MNFQSGNIAESHLLTTEDDGRQAQRWRVALGVLAVALIALGAWYFFARANGAKADSTAPEAQLLTVTVAVPGTTAVDRTISATGSLAARVDMPVGSVGEGGMVTRVLVQPGTWVRAGQVLAEIDQSVQVQTAAQLAAQIRVAKSDARLAQAELERAQALVGNGFISKADLDRKAAARDAANARVAVAEAQLSETRARTGRLLIRAPAAGLVLTRTVEPGQVVGPSSGTLFRLARDGALEMRAALSETDLASINVGAAARVTPVGSARSFDGTVWQVSPVVDPQTRQGIARIALRYDPALRPGGFAAVMLVAGRANAPLLPQSALQSDDKGNYVYVVNAKNEVERRAIKTGQVSDAGVAIIDGLSGQERIVVSAGAFLNPGQKVMPVMAGKRG